MKNEQLLVSVLLAIAIVGAAWIILMFVESQSTPPTYYAPVQYQSPQPVTYVMGPTAEDTRQQMQQQQLQQENRRLRMQYDDLANDLYERESRRIDLTVIVRDDEDGDRIEDAKVRIEDGEDDIDYTDDDGEAHFYNLRRDCYDIRVSADDYDSESRTFCLEDDERISFSLDRD